ncbi:unnamed protein product [Pleuronectes platessa]|uniref:Uncharacterized protein n=1 Tax=Pleuronectes platessa TaxID=8262 RepID=A0A9N7TVK1_PLEPL|nr:unnamed protein product [Pleuronectes platessa]
MVPSNLIEATFQQYKTDLIPILKVQTRTVQPNFVYLVPDEDDPRGRTVYLELTPPPEITYKTKPGSSQQMNVLGIVIFSATMGEQDEVHTLCSSSSSPNVFSSNEEETSGFFSLLHT